MEIPHIPNLIYYAIPFFLVSVIFEGIIIHRKRPSNYNIKDTLASLSMGIGNIIIDLASKLVVVFVITMLYENYRITDIPFSWWAWLIVLFADDFCYYWAHRIWLDAKPAGAAIGRQYHLIVIPGTHKTQTALTFP